MALIYTVCQRIACNMFLAHPGTMIHGAHGIGKALYSKGMQMNANDITQYAG